MGFITLGIVKIRMAQAIVRVILVAVEDAWAVRAVMAIHRVVVAVAVGEISPKAHRFVAHLKRPPQLQSPSFHICTF